MEEPLKWYEKSHTLGVIHKVRKLGVGGGGGGIWANAYANVLVNGWRHKKCVQGGGRGGAKNSENFAYVLYGWPLSHMYKELCWSLTSYLLHRIVSYTILHTHRIRR